jgi:hypothetical protein
MLFGEANREAPAQAELRPTCAGATFSPWQTKTVSEDEVEL